MVKDAAPGTVAPGTPIPELPANDAPQTTPEAETPIPPARKKPGPKPGTRRPRVRPTTRAGRAQKATQTKARRDAPPPKNRPRLGEQVTASIQTLATLLQGFGLAGNPVLGYDGRVLMENSVDLGALVEELAVKDPRVLAALERMFSVGSWGKVGTVLAATAVPIMANHGLVPVGFAGLFAGPRVGMPPDRPPRPARNATPGRNGGAPRDATPGRMATVATRTPPPPPPAATWVGPQPQNDTQAVAGRNSHPDLPGWPADMPLPWEAEAAPA